MHRWTAADCVTALRIVGAGALCVPEANSGAFLAICTLAGLTDAVDGTLARRTNTASAFGARLDSIADLLFYSVLIIRLLPILRQRLPLAAWCLIGATVATRIVCYAVCALKYRRLASLHTYLNKLTSAAIFLLPYVLALCHGVGYCWFVSIVGAASTVEELLIHLLGLGAASNAGSLAALLRKGR